MKFFSSLLSAWLNKIPGMTSLSLQVRNVSVGFIEQLTRYDLTRWLANILKWFSDIDFGFIEKYANFIEAGRERSQELVFDALRNNPVYKPNTRFVTLTLDMDFMGCGDPFCNYETQLSQIIALKKKYPYQLLPFVSVDPRRGNAEYLLEFVKKHIEQLGFVGIKMYPALGFYPFDPRLKLVYEYAQANAIPVMTHCTQGGVYYKGKLTDDQLRPLCLNPNSKKYDFTPDKKLKNSQFKNHFSNPNNYKEVLEIFPRLKLCIAHFGGGGQVRNFKQRKDNWYWITKELVSGYRNTKGMLCENIYTDISYTLYDRKIFRILKKDICGSRFRPDLKYKILFGTDFYMTQQERREELLVKDFFRFLNDSESVKVPPAFFSKARRYIHDPDAEKRITSENAVNYLASQFFNP